MNLDETVRALEAKGISVAINMGEHQYCLIDSNCPIAIELRKIIGESRITLAQLLEGYEAVTVIDPVNCRRGIPEVNATLKISMGGKFIDIDLQDVLKEELQSAISRKIQEINSIKEQIESFGRGLYFTYKLEIDKTRKSKVLPQLTFSYAELSEANCFYTSEGSEYVFYYPREYKPEYLIRDGVRFSISGEDIQQIKREVVYKITVTKDGRFLFPLILTRDGNKLSHYHGRNGDCWGNVALPSKWNNSLRSINRLIRILEGSLVTINLNSLMNREPAGMPYVDSLLCRATRLGREGETDSTAQSAITATPTAGRAPGWGRDRR